MFKRRIVKSEQTRIVGKKNNLVAVFFGVTIFTFRNIIAFVTITFCAVISLAKTVNALGRMKSTTMRIWVERPKQQAKKCQK